MIRSRPTKIAIALVALIPLAMILAGLYSLRQLPDEQTLGIAVATPTLYVGFVILAVLAPLVSGGGYELYPADQLVSYPVRPATVFRSTLVLAPVNLAWMLNVIALFVLTGFSAGPVTWGPTARSLVTVAAFIGTATVVGHALGWLVMGIRQSRRGRVVTNLTGLLVVLTGLLVFWTDRVVDFLESSPTKYVLLGSYDGYFGRYSEWLTVMAVLLALCLVFARIGEAVTGWALRRPGDHADRTSSRSLTRRTTHGTGLRALLAVDHASLWRSTPLRRGTLVLVLVPGLVAALAGMSWQSLVLVPGLIAAGAGLLFGINAFTLDSTGSVWLSTLPHWSTPAFISKTVVFTEVALAAVASALIGGSLRAPTPAHAAEVTAAVASALSCVALVVALGMRSSLKHPHRADLNGPRDTPATPGVMAAQSVRFAAVTTVSSLVFGALAFSGQWWVPALAAVAVLSGCVLHLMSTARAWDHPHVRAFVVGTVAGG
jgi:hypothetical protein